MQYPNTLYVLFRLRNGGELRNNCRQHYSMHLCGTVKYDEYTKKPGDLERMSGLDVYFCDIYTLR